MHTKKYLCLVTIFACALAGTCSSLEAAPMQDYELTFDDVVVGTLPPSWKIDATNPGGKLAEWQVVADDKATSRPNVLTIVKINDHSTGVFNLCWTKDIAFQDGVIEVNIRANSGKEDQGGGVIWRVKNANNYYLARYNPLESNFRIYSVRGGHRKTVASADGLHAKAGKWFRLKVSQAGDMIEGYFDGRKYLDVKDTTFKEAGGVGLWSKSDAASSFDDFSVLPLSRR